MQTATYYKSKRNFIVIGRPASVMVKEHPVLGEDVPVLTSCVIDYDIDGTFYTMNTKYIPVEEDRDAESTILS